jgi:uncharacterized Zn finger protein (UPF0148 family)
MNKAKICQDCGTAVLGVSKDILICPICKSKLITEEEAKYRAEMTEMIEQDEDDTLSPKQDAIEDLLDERIAVSMKQHIEKLGNDFLYSEIEKLTDPYKRYAYRAYFVISGGIIPKGQTITIEEKRK